VFALRVAVGLSALWALAGLLWAWRGARSFGPKVYRSAPGGSASAGVFYAFGAGLLPSAKESVRTHRGSWAAGLGYHAGLFASLGLLAAFSSDLELPLPVARALGAVALIGAACGLGLFAKRAASGVLRSLSVPDDYLSNGLATLMAALAGLAALGLSPAAAALAAGVALLLYLPLGKIRHCLFFFPARYHFGVFFGRRGVFPPAGEAGRG